MQQKLAIFVSGDGTNLQAIFFSGVRIHLVVADRPCRALEVAREAGIPLALVERTDFTSSLDYEAHAKQLLALCERYQITFIALAGYKTILVDPILSHYAGKILNIHPSMLPSFPGPHAVRDVLAAGLPGTGCSVHYVTADVDGGRVVARKVVPIYAGDSEASLHARIKAEERLLYPRVISEELAKQ